VRQEPDEDEYEENILVRWICRAVPTTDDYHEHRMTVRIDGKRLMTPMLIVMVAIGSTDLLFALDSIPAIFGLTKQSYLVFTANAFALMGLRQLYFLLRGLLDRLVYLSKGLAVILAFIGVKLVLEAMHTTWFENVPEISTFTSLAVIGVTMLVTTVASLIKTPRHPVTEGAQPEEDGQDRRPRRDGGPGDAGEVDSGPTVPGPAVPDAAGRRPDPEPDPEPQPSGPVPDGEADAHADQTDADADARAGRIRR
jgi:tellurite resistance protein TerC